jgi:hypothetical protein
MTITPHAKTVTHGRVMTAVKARSGDDAEEILVDGPDAELRLLWGGEGEEGPIEEPAWSSEHATGGVQAGRVQLLLPLQPLGWLVLLRVPLTPGFLRTPADPVS